MDSNSNSLISNNVALLKMGSSLSFKAEWLSLPQKDTEQLGISQMPSNPLYR